MSGSDELKPSQIGGCLTAMLRLTITLPIWYTLLFGILSRIECPTWMWIAFWIYTPVGILLSFVEEFLKGLNKAGS